MRLSLHGALLAFALGFAPSAVAVDQTGIKVGERWSVVGVIGGAVAGRSVAVLRDNVTKKTYTLAVGDALPSDAAGFTLKAVLGRTVEVASARETVTLGAAEETYDEPAESPSRTSRFLDAYYRGLGETVGEAATGTLLPLSRLGGRAEPRSRYELYRDGRPARAELEEADGPVGDGAGGFVVTYDNFEENGESFDVVEGEEGSLPHQPTTLPALSTLMAPPLDARTGLPLVSKTTLPPTAGAVLPPPVSGVPYDAAVEQVLDESAPQD